MLNQQVVALDRTTHRTAVCLGISTEEQWAAEAGECASVSWREGEPIELPDNVYTQIRRMVIDTGTRLSEIEVDGIKYRIGYYNDHTPRTFDHRNDSDAGIIADWS